MQLDLFTATANNWGLILAIRTGSADFSHYRLAQGWRRAGYYSEEGMLHKNYVGTPIAIREETELFNLIGEKWINPEDRTI